MSTAIPGTDDKSMLGLRQQGCDDGAPVKMPAVDDSASGVIVSHPQHGHVICHQSAVAAQNRPFLPHTECHRPRPLTKAGRKRKVQFVVRCPMYLYFYSMAMG